MSNCFCFILSCLDNIILFLAMCCGAHYFRNYQGQKAEVSRKGGSCLPPQMLTSTATLLSAQNMKALNKILSEERNLIL